MRIGILHQGGAEWIAGVIYLENLIRALDLLTEEEKPSLYFILGQDNTVADFQQLGARLPRLQRYVFRTGDSLKSKVLSTLKSGSLTRWPVSFEQVTEGLKLSVLFPIRSSLGSNFSCSWIGWIPDFQHKRMPQNFSESELEGRDECFNGIVRDASHVVVSSQDALRDLVRWFPTSSERVNVFPFVSVAAKEWYAEDPQQTITRFGLPRKYLIFPSQFWVHKNHRCVFEAIRILKGRLSSDITLVCTGRMNDHRHPRYGQELLTDLKNSGLERNVYCLGLLERQAQIQLLRGAAAVIQPSFFEGWSSLVEDARTLSKRIYVSDVPIHREQNPPDAEYFDPNSPEDLANLIARDWNQLVPGPDILKEREAFTNQSSRAVDFARLFLQITRKLCHHGN